MPQEYILFGSLDNIKALKGVYNTDTRTVFKDSKHSEVGLYTIEPVTVCSWVNHLIILI